MSSLRSRLAQVWVASVPLLLLAGCPSSRTLDSDAEITFDAAGIDGGRVRPDAPDAYVPMCGNSRIEGGEECDDGNLAGGDGCDAMCSREAYCGDSTVDAGEECDDGNHRSADGCRSDCLSDETCGNGIVDFATGEVCDDGNTVDGDACSTMCTMLAGCGDGMVTPPEGCDDMNLERWDACGNDCEDTVSFVLDMPAFADRGIGCDYSGDGRPDNQFANAAGDALTLLNMFFGMGGPTFMMSFLGLDDPAAINDPSLRVAWLQAQDAGGGTYRVDPGTLNPDGTATTSVESSIVARMLDGGPEDLDFQVPFLPLTLRDAYIRGTTVATAGEVSSITDGLVCGAVPLEPLTFLTESLIEGFGSMGGFMIDIPPPCDGSTDDSTMADWLVGGASIAIIRINPASPDVDLDSDGLETFEVDRPGSGEDCQPVIVACVDGDGTRVTGRDCIFDTRFADGYSAALQYTATRVVTVGSGP